MKWNMIFVIEKGLRSYNSSFKVFFSLLTYIDNLYILYIDYLYMERKGRYGY
ncbi:hypothetical protein [Tissierella carlieri]|uniref:hypothetical protein n=1 Tax=Tissierella carlieri TaxID=689904 RepID=UPI00386B2AE5